MPNGKRLYQKRWAGVKHMKKNILKHLLSIFLVLSGIIVIAALTLQLYAYNTSWYMSRMDKLEINEYTGINRTDIERICGKLTGYLKGTTQDINITATVHGTTREVFNDKEKQHMIDVRKIFDHVRIITVVSVLIFFGCLFSLAKFFPKKTLYRSLILIGGVPIVFLAMLTVVALIDFHEAFTVFHKIFFTNELWLLDPRTDILIQMLPQPFFEQTALVWGITALVLFIACITAGVTGLIKEKNRNKE